LPFGFGASSAGSDEIGNADAAAGRSRVFIKRNSWRLWVQAAECGGAFP
jgi:hypothetical protein